jgi:formate--tetrahydrofolate ligase
MPREERFDITAASEVMAILALAEDLDDLKARLGRVLIGYTVDRQPVYAQELKAAGPMTLLLRQALQPNLVQTVEGVPAFVHAGPFANIAHGCNSVIATKTALGHADIVVTEAGFGFDLGAEKFLNIKCRGAGLYPSALVLVTTVRAMKMHGGVGKADLALANRKALKTGLANLDRHLASAKAFGIPVVVSINHFTGDRKDELKVIEDHCAEQGVPCAVSKVFSEGGKGGDAVAEHVLAALKGKAPKPKFTYDASDSVEAKIEKIVRSIYGGDSVILAQKARNQLKVIDRLGLSNLPVCMAKTQYSVSDNPKAVGAPTGFEVTVSELRIAAGAGFIVAVTGAMMTMPGLPRRPASESMDVRADGGAVGMF